MDGQLRSLEMFAKDIAEGLLTLNPISIKKFETDQYKPLLGFIRKAMNDIRVEGFPHSQPDLIRKRNARLLRLNQSVSMLENIAREKKVKL
ncbi:MAG TPA: hypothetical protein VN944_12060 [Nitrospiria bacterium]|nr:hypothetical protein [Nitrospiria bacterium]